MTNRHLGSTFEGFLDEKGILEEVDALAQKRVIAWQIEEAMEKQGITKIEMAERMHTSRTQIDRLLDPDNNKVQLDTLQRAANAVGCALKLELVGTAKRFPSRKPALEKVRPKRSLPRRSKPAVR